MLECPCDDVAAARGSFGTFDGPEGAGQAMTRLRAIVANCVVVALVDATLSYALVPKVSGITVERARNTAS